MKKNSLQIFSESFYPATTFGGPIFSLIGLINDISQDFKVNVFTMNIDNKLNKKKLTYSEIENAKTKLGYPIIYSNSYLGRIRLSPVFKYNFIKHYLLGNKIYIQGFFNWIVLIYAFLSIFYKNKKIIIAPRGSLGRWSISQKNIKKKIFILIIKYLLPEIKFHVTSLEEEKDIQEISKNWITFICPNQVSFARPKINEKKKTNDIIAVGRHEKQKGFDILIKNFLEVEKKRKSLKLFIIGVEGSQTLYLKQLAKGSKNIKFIDHLSRKELMEVMQNCLALFSTSHYENYGNTILEALSCDALVVIPSHLPWKHISGFTFQYNIQYDNISKILLNIANIKTWHKSKLFLQQSFVKKETKLTKDLHLEMISSLD
ncbi:MAG: hypothetical protein CBB97_07615 [Candidatus Endolissoclinum sp. TMED37]|nr:MAG: hypothetical protein CBB97_07615 [Candidatus Endolissoclinum sp. TMED37]|tara:strand:+ start:493 stop:1611 length:1119 start_codon:yes stop_codon:yes gene_type:complete